MHLFAVSFNVNWITMNLYLDLKDFGILILGDNQNGYHVYFFFYNFNLLTFALFDLRVKLYFEV